MRNHYKTLGVSLDATESEIKRAYRSLAKKYHPDRGGSEEKFKTLSEAYTEVLKAAKRGVRFQETECGGGMSQQHRDFWRQGQCAVCGQFNCGGHTFHFTGACDGFDFKFDLFVFPGQMAARIKQRFTFCRPGPAGPEDVHLMIAIPSGMVFGDTVRIKGAGGYGRNGGKHGDLYLIFREKSYAEKNE